MQPQLTLATQRIYWASLSVQWVWCSSWKTVQQIPGEHCLFKYETGCHILKGTYWICLVQMAWRGVMQSLTQPTFMCAKVCSKGCMTAAVVQCYIPSILGDRHTLQWRGGRSPHSGMGTAAHTALHGCREDNALRSFAGVVGSEERRTPKWNTKQTRKQFTSGSYKRAAHYRAVAGAPTQIIKHSANSDRRHQW